MVKLGRVDDVNERVSCPGCALASTQALVPLPRIGSRTIREP